MSESTRQAEFLLRLRRFVLNERDAQRHQIEKEWSKPLVERVADRLTVQGVGSAGLLRGGPVMPKWNRRFAGEWRIVELLDMGDDYMEEGEGKPYIRLKARYEDVVDGEYECGLTNGVIDGAVRSFGGEHILIFGFEGMDEMDMENGGGWLRLRDDGLLEGEFVNHLGRFVAKRMKRRPSKKSPPRRKT